MANEPTKYVIEWRDSSGNFKQQLQPWANDVKWEWNRKGGCGRCGIKLSLPYRKFVFSALDDVRIKMNTDAIVSPYAHYKCNDNAANTTVTDNGTGANNGTGNVNTSNYSVAGKINDAFELNGSSEYINIDSLQAAIASDTVGSISLWLSKDSLSATSAVLSFGDTVGTNSTIYISVDTLGRILVYANNVTTDWGVRTGALISAGAWHHVLLVHDGIEPKIYVDGDNKTLTYLSDVDRTTWFSGITNIDNGRIGSYNNNGSGDSLFWDGKIDDIRYYTVALDQEDVDAIYNSGNGSEIVILTTQTTKLVYRGWIAGVNPLLKDAQEISLDIRGYFDLLKYIIVQNSDVAKTYTSTLVSDIVDDIADTFITPNTAITKGTIDASGYTADSLSFKVTVEDALRTLADLEGGVEYGVDEDLVFFWHDEGTSVVKKFIAGDNIKILQRKEDFSKIINKYYLEGKETAGVPYVRTGENTSSQSTYFLREAIIQNGAVSTNSVADQLISALLSANDAPKYQMNLTIPNTSLRLEDNIPLGKVSIYDVEYDEFSAAAKLWGTTYNGGDNVLWGKTASGGDNQIWTGGSGVFQDQVDFIRYELSETFGRFNIVIGMGGSRDETAGKIKQIELDLQNIRQGRA